jgi:tripartite ATP-independent transporter DctM subunit
MLVIMADQVGVSAGDLFMGAVFPGLILGIMYITFILVYSLLRPDKAPLSETRPPLSIRVLWDTFKSTLPAVALILAVLGSIFAGITTVTEASGVGALGAAVLAATNRKLNFTVLKDVVRNTFKVTGYIFGIFIGATCFALVLRGLGGDELIETALTGLPLGSYGIILIILAAVFLLGFFLDWIEITLIILPLLAPVIGGLSILMPDYGVIDQPMLIWFLVLVAVALQTSFLTPPVGFALFYLRGVAPNEVQLIHIYKGVVPFIILQLIGLGVIMKWPQLVLWLPSLAYGN